MSLKLLPLLLCTLMLKACDKQTEDEALTNKMSNIRGYYNWYIGKFRCGVFVPPSYDPGKKYPLVVILHGHSDTTSWNYRWYNEPFISKDPCIVLSPKCPVGESEGWGNSWSPEISPMMQKTFEVMEIAKRAFNLDISRFYIHGTSMGAIGTYGVLQKRPGLFTAAYLECGAGNTAIAPLLVNTPLWIFHGSNDYVVIVYPDRDMYQSVREHGGKQIRYTEYKGVGHNVWDYTKNETTLPFWLLAQQKGVVHGNPDSVRYFASVITADKKIRLEWIMPSGDPKSDNDIWYYRIYRNGEMIKEIDNIYSSYTDTTAVTNVTYAYQISAVNFFFKESLRTKAKFIKADENLSKH